MKNPVIGIPKLPLLPISDQRRLFDELVNVARQKMQSKVADKEQ